MSCNRTRLPSNQIGFGCLQTQSPTSWITRVDLEFWFPVNRSSISGERILVSDCLFYFGKIMMRLSCWSLKKNLYIPTLIGTWHQIVCWSLSLRLLGPCTVKGCPSLPRKWRKTGRSSLSVLVVVDVLLLLSFCCDCGVVVVVVVVVVAGGGGGGGGSVNAWLLQEHGPGDTSSRSRSAKTTVTYYLSIFVSRTAERGDDFGWLISTKLPPANELDTSWWPS